MTILNEKIILGTAQFGLDYGINNNEGKLNEKKINSILDFAFEHNIRFLDTAEAYGDSQKTIGDYHKKFGQKFEIITKFNSKETYLPLKLSEKVKQNLEILNVDCLYCYMFHSFNDFKLFFLQYKVEIEDLKKRGLIKKLGVSVYTNEEAEQLLKYDKIDIVQLPYNLLDNANKRADIIERLKKRGVEVHTRSTFLQGLFFKKEEELPNKLKVLLPYVQELKRIAKENVLDLNSMSLNYVISQKNIDNVLIGVDSVEQLIENMDVLNQTLPESVIQEIDLIDVKETALLNPSNWKE